MAENDKVMLDPITIALKDSVARIEAGQEAMMLSIQGMQKEMVKLGQIADKQIRLEERREADLQAIARAHRRCDKLEDKMEAVLGLRRLVLWMGSILGFTVLNVFGALIYYWTHLPVVP